MVKLHTGRVLRDVPHCGGELEQVLGDPAVSKLGETVVDQASVQTSNECSWNRNCQFGEERLAGCD